MDMEHESDCLADYLSERGPLGTEAIYGYIRACCDCSDWQAAELLAYSVINGKLMAESESGAVEWYSLPHRPRSR